jgi:Ca2+-binding RTX toxin-like protein
MSTQTTFASTVNSFYLAFYGRPADPAGLAFWTRQLADNDGNLSAITQAFATSEEAQVRYGSDTVNERISEIYQALFNRAPDSVGLAYWSNVVGQGHASMADVAVAIMGGAQGIDKALTTLRQTAVDAFTAQVEASGSQYSGYASVEAARILVRAVTVDTATGDIDALVKAAVSFADTASKTPQVVDAIASGTTLLALFDTTRGKGDPVALAQTLGDTAKAAAGNPVTLDSLLRGGGMDQVLKVMPANASLKDVVAALAKGGLPAAIEVVYPPTPVVTAPVPTFNLKLAFEHVTQDDLDRTDDNVTNQSAADVTFSYTGRDLRTGQHFEYSLDGKHWIDTNIDVDANTNTVTLKHVQLGYQFPTLTMLGNDNAMSIMAPAPEQVTTIALRAVDANGTTTTPVTQTIVFDGYTLWPHVTLATDSHHGELGSNNDWVTNDGTLNLEYVETGATVEYLVQQQHGIVNANDASVPTEVWTATPALHEGMNVVQVRVTDVAGNRSYEQFTLTLDTEAPDTPAIALHNAPSNGSTTSGVIDITGLDKNSGTAWEYSTDKGKTWIYGDTNDGSGADTLELSDVGSYSVQVRQYDVAGNIGTRTAALDFTIEAPAHTLYVYSNENGVELKSSVAGAILMETSSNITRVMSTANGGDAIAGWVSVGVQDQVTSGTFAIEPAQGALVKDANQLVYTLGSAVTDFLKNASNAWGFDGDDVIYGSSGDDQLYGGGGDDELLGNNGNDRLSGGAGNDWIDGGSGGDRIFVGEGIDTLVYNSAADSNLSTYLWSSQSAPSIDSVAVQNHAAAIFDFSQAVAKIYMSSTQIVSSSTSEERYQALTDGYNEKGATVNDAVIFKMNDFNLLVLDNGDGVIDDNDIVVEIIGNGYFSLDSQGNVWYGNID